MTIKKLSNEETSTAANLFRFFQENDGVSNPQVPETAYLKALLGKTDFHVLVALEGETLTGGLTAYELPMYKAKKTKLFLYEIGVRPAWRRQGVGTQLMQELEEFCKKRGIREIFLETSRANRAAIRLFENCGGTAKWDRLSFVYTPVEKS